MGELLVPNGVDATTGTYVEPPRTLADLGLIARDLAPEPKRLEEARSAVEHKVLALRPGYDPCRLEDCGWGVVFAQDADPAAREALSELLTHRRGQAGERYRELTGDAGYRAGESKRQFLTRHEVGHGAVDPRRMPFYLLLVGGPEEIPYLFQSQLDLHYAVGRVAFDTPGEYARWARAVVESETSPPAASRRALFFGVQNPGDRVTELTVQYLVKRVAEFLAGDQPELRVEAVAGREATKERLVSLLTETPPQILFTASHGLSFPPGHLLQRDHQGALLCGDWPGPEAWRGAIPEDHYLAAADLGEAVHPSGMISFHYACHGAGTPRFDAWAGRRSGTRRQLAPRPFVARLPQRLLAHGALAAVGHVDRSWGYSYLWQGVGSHTQAFEDTLKLLAEGHPLGLALEPFNQRYAELAEELKTELELADFGAGQKDPELLPRLWTATNDARNYVIVGDPAVRLPTKKPGPATAAGPGL